MLQFSFAQSEDLPRIVSIYNQTVPTRLATADLKPVSVESRRTWFASHTQESRPLWVMKMKDEVVIGWISLGDFYGRPAYSHTAEISLYIDEQYRGQRLGQLALAFVEKHLQRLEVNTLLAFVFGHNMASQNLFKKNGFEIWGHLPKVALMDDQLRDLDILGKRYQNGI
ncbi:MAG TPA: GNAT family N-acetyltransferase [Ruminococcaceae bacterium]|nr:GNAT family N-acetyltransferase [Oscillospiraceae bacterium]